MKRLLFGTSLIVASALLHAQNAGQQAGLVPGQPGWTGQTVQIGQPRPNPQVGGLDPADIVKPLADEWRSYSGDLSGKRFSNLKLVNTATVKNLSLKWITTLTTGCGPTGTAPAAGAGGGPGGAGGGGGGGGRGGRGGGGGEEAPIIVGGLGNGEANNCA